MKSKKAISPVISTVLLVVIVVVLGSVVFLWGRDFVSNSQSPSKFGEPAERACERIKFEAGIFPDGVGGHVIEINNQGNIDIYGFSLLVGDEGEKDVIELLDENVLAGNSKTLNQSHSFSTGEEVIITPLILAESSRGEEVVFYCPEQYSEKIVVN